MRFLAFSDLHLDAPFARGGTELAAIRRAAIRSGLQRIVELATASDVDAVLCAGDLYEHERFTPDTAALLQRSFAELGSTPVVIAPGNHDWLGPSSLYNSVSWSDNVFIAREARLCPLDVVDGVRFWTAAHLAPGGTRGFLDNFSVEGSAVNIGVFHGSELGGWHREGDADKVQHAPFRAEQVPASGLAHAVVGHHHRRTEGEHHTYPGCPVPLSFGEAGDGGAVVVELGPDGRVASRTWHGVSDLAAHDLVVELDGCDDSGELARRVDAAVGDLAGVARVTLQGELSPSLTIEPVVLEERRGGLLDLQVRVGVVAAGYDLEAVAAEPTVRGQFVRDVLGSQLPSDEQQRVIITGLRALAGRDDLEVA